MTQLSDSELDNFHRLGFHIFEGLFTGEECEALKASIDQLMADRKAKCERFICEYAELGHLICDHRIMDIVEQVMGSGFVFHHLHAVRQEAGTPGVHWHQDYEQCPHTNRKHIMVHIFYYFNGLNGTIGDLLLVPSTQRTVIDNGALSVLGTENLPGTMVVNSLPPGSAVLVHSALWHARRAQPGGEGTPRYFADASYCQSGILWPAYGRRQWREILQCAKSLGLDHGGEYPHLFDETMFFDYLKARSVLERVEGSLLLQVPGWEEGLILERDIILVTGASGKVGQAFIAKFLAERTADSPVLRALCHNRMLREQDGLESIRGNISQQEDVKRAMQGVKHVVHLATCKETPQDVMDVTVKGLFWLLEECRESSIFRRFILLGGDAGMGHFFYPHPDPVTEHQPHSAYPGCYALSKVLEEVMVEQYRIQYGLDGCCLRAPWIMEKDDFKYTLSFGEDVFGGPRWRDIVGPEAADSYIRSGAVPLMLAADGAPMKRNFVHLDDLVEAIIIALDAPGAASKTFNICMDEPVDYAEVAEYLAKTGNLPSVKIPTQFHSTWLDNTRAKFLLGWRPKVDLPALIDRAWNYERDPGRSKDNLLSRLA